MARCKCKNAYKRRADGGVCCLAVEGDMDFCGHQKFCPTTQQWEVNCTGLTCPLKNAPAVKKAPIKVQLR